LTQLRDPLAVILSTHDKMLEVWSK
jgi:hypothetical protein